MIFRIINLKKIFNYRNKKVKRNVVYKIGYDKFSLSKFFVNMKNYITSVETQNKIQKIKTKFKEAIKRV